MKIEWIELEKLKLDPRNVRLHDEKNLAAISQSLEQFGQQKPIVVDQENCIVAGNGTYQAAKRLGWDKIAIARTSLSGEEKIAFAIADNRTAELADWDDQALADQLKNLRETSEFYLAAGFEDSEIDAMLDALQEVDSLPDEVALEPMYQVVVQCDDETQQHEAYSLLQGEGFSCRLLNL